MINTKLIHLANLTKEEYPFLHDIFHTEPYLKYDHPDRPLPSKERSAKFWDEKVATGICRFWGIYTTNDQKLVGVINAFDFSSEKQSCETGINIYPPENFGKGYAVAAYKLLHEILKDELQIKSINIMTSTENRKALNVYRKLGYTDGGLVDDEGMVWQGMQYNLYTEPCSDN